VYQFPEKINFDNFFRMDKHLVMSKHWGKLPLASKSIYPVIAIHANSKGVAFPSQETIGRIAGCTPKTVREGLAGLIGFPGFHLDYWTTSRGKRACKYLVKPAPNLKGESMRVYKSFFEGGNWSQSSSVAHAVYPVLLAFSYFDFSIYQMLLEDEDPAVFESVDHNEFFTEGHFEQRQFDIADPEIDVLAEYAGISRRSVYAAFESLEADDFIQKASDYWKVFRSPPKSYKREYLNARANITL
jgi:hypothetical protein